MSSCSFEDNAIILLSFYFVSSNWSLTIIYSKKTTTTILIFSPMCTDTLTFYLDNFMSTFYITIQMPNGETRPNGTVLDPQGFFFFLICKSKFIQTKNFQDPLCPLARRSPRMAKRSFTSTAITRRDRIGSCSVLLPTGKSGVPLCERSKESL